MGGRACSEELACTYQVTGERVKATSVTGSSDLNIWPEVMSFQRSVSRAHSLAAILPALAERGCSAFFSLPRRTVIHGEMSKTSENGCCAKDSVGAQFFYHLPFTACAKSHEMTFLGLLLPAGYQLGLPMGGGTHENRRQEKDGSHYASGRGFSEGFLGSWLHSHP